MKLTFKNGTILIDGEYSVPHTQWDGRVDDQRCLAHRYKDISKYLKNSEIPYKDEVLDLVPCPELECDVELRSYQKKALERWMQEKRGVLVLPTGSGKTYIAMKAVEVANSPAFIVVPTLDLIDQWKKELKDFFNIDIGEISGREKNIKPITVSTYDSAYNHAEKLGNKFKMIVFDEVHHLPSEGYRHIAEFFASPFRLGLTATYEREDGLHERLPELMGGKVYEIGIDDLAGSHLSKYSIERISVDMKPKEKEKYGECMKKFKNYLVSRNIKMTGPDDFRKVVLRSGNDPEAWKAVRARNKARKIAYNSESKIDEVSNLLDRHKYSRIILFTRYNEVVYKISKKFLIPAITHKTPNKERREILERFKSGIYTAIASSQVLDEGIDVPDADTGIIISGTGSNREYTQRLGRLLRPSDKEAKLYEIVSSGTSEMQTSYRRRG